MNLFNSIPDDVREIIDKIEYNGYEAYIVGGCVRDCVMGVAPHDYDLCTNALPEKILEIFGDDDIVDAGLKHGTVGVIKNHNVYEITTYRIDGIYSDGRHPDSVQFTSLLKEDLRRRDFTINAMAYNPKTGLVDVFGGRDDIKNGIIRCVGNAKERFGEDALRILRAIRFASRFNFDIDTDTVREMHAQYPSIENVSIERICTELTQSIMCKNAPRYFLEFRDIISFIIPEMNNISDINYQKNLNSLNKSSEDIYIKLSLLLNSIDGVTVKKILKRLRCSNVIIDKVSTFVGCCNIELSNTKKDTKLLLQKFGYEDLLRFLEIKYLTDTNINKATIKGIAAIAKAIIANNECYNVKTLAINGDILKEIGVKNGLEIGKTLNILVNEVINENLENDRDVLIKYVKKTLKSNP